VNSARAVLIAMISIACMSLSSFAQARQIRVAGDPYPPWAEGEVGSKPTGGIAVEIVEELFRRLNMETDVNIYPFKRGLERIEHGEEDVILMVSRSKERDEYMLFTLPIRRVKFVFYYPADLENFDWKDWKDLQTYNIGTVTGQNIGEDWKDAIKKYNLKVEEVKSDVFNVDKLLLERLDIIATDHEVMQRIINNNPQYQGKLKWHQKPIFESINNIGISKKSFLAPILPKINGTLQEMKSDGTFDRIFCAYKKIYRASCENN
jgi:polar amino acid transport system substrate-binding protein